MISILSTNMIYEMIFFAQGIYRILFKSSSSFEKGTLSQLKVLINNSANIDPAKNMKGCEDLFLIALHAHVTAAAKSILNDKQYDNVEDLAKEIIVRYLFLHPDDKVVTKDKKYLYAQQVLTLTFLWRGFNDAVHEGDGDRLLIYWKFFTVVFKVTRHSNYLKEAILFQLQYYFLLPKRQAEQLKWSRFVNSKGREGCNISCDLHIEHLNRRLKTVMTGMHSDVKAIDHAAKAIGIIHRICEVLEEDTYAEGNKHDRPSFAKECRLMVNELIEQNIFVEQSGRSHASFKGIKPVLQQCPSKQFLPIMAKKLKTYQL